VCDWPTWIVLAIVFAIFPLWLALVVAVLLIGAVVSNNDIGFDNDSDDEDDDDYLYNDADHDDDDDDDDEKDTCEAENTAG